VCGKALIFTTFIVASIAEFSGRVTVIDFGQKNGEFFSPHFNFIPIDSPLGEEWIALVTFFIIHYGILKTFITILVFMYPTQKYP
jgi:hypothetical protein